MKEDIFDDINRDELISCIDEWIRNETDRAMIKRRLLDGICYEPLSEEFGFSTIQCYRRIQKAKKQLFKHIKL